LCKACIQGGEKKKNLEITEDENITQNEEEFECDFHPNSKGNFYCDDCRVFLCKICFANEHRTHNSNLPSDIAMSFKINIQNLVQTVSLFEPKIDSSIKVINDLENKLKSIRESSAKKLSGIVLNINKLFVEKNQNFLEEYKANLDQTDEDIFDVNHRLGTLQTRIVKFLDDVSEIKNNFNNVYNNNPIETCLYKQKLKKFFEEAKKIFQESKYLIGSKVDISIQKANEKIEEFKEISQKLYKKIKVFRSSVINSIQTGISSFSLRVRRFTKFSKIGIKYYKTSSLKFRTNNPVSIVGFAICGLHIDENSRKQLNSNSQNNENRSYSVTINNNSNNNNNDYNDSKSQNVPKSANKTKINNSKSLEFQQHNTPQTSTQEITVPFKFAIKELKNNDSENTPIINTNINNANTANEELIQENFFLKEIKNPIDPIITYYLNKSINISPDKTYIVTITNLNKEVYLDLWTGEVSKYYINLMSQGIKCNSSHIKFEFNPPEGIESDFNEFNCGIIADLIYSYKEK